MLINYYAVGFYTELVQFFIIFSCPNSVNKIIPILQWLHVEPVRSLFTKDIVLFVPGKRSGAGARSDSTNAQLMRAIVPRHHAAFVTMTDIGSAFWKYKRRQEKYGVTNLFWPMV